MANAPGGSGDPRVMNSMRNDPNVTGDEIPERQTKGARKEWTELENAPSNPRLGAIPRTWGSVERTEPTPGWGAGQHPDEAIDEGVADVTPKENAAILLEGFQPDGYSRGTYGNSKRRHP